MLEYFAGHEHAAPIFLVAIFFAATVLAMGCVLPAQNIFAATGILAVFTALTQTVGEKLHVPFGPFFYTENLGRPLLYLVPWPIIILWPAVILNSRGAVALILRHRRDAPSYGIFSMLLTCLLTVLFDAALEPYAARTHHFWIWETQKPFLSWYSAPWFNFASRFLITLILLACAMPWLINKKPVTNPPPDYFPLALWSGAMIFLIVANTTNHLWPAVILGAIITGAVTILALKNSRSPG
ncbi:MAG TPA: carotenoid biosynthesis protein [Verrucomicrobiae bacterium]|jgi:uncharacterized membrane protein|nr:carotenoid biosynthesis protein [Verrucomicrobiae bacterium]